MELLELGLKLMAVLFMPLTWHALKQDRRITVIEASTLKSEQMRSVLREELAPVWEAIHALQQCVQKRRRDDDHA